MSEPSLLGRPMLIWLAHAGIDQLSHMQRGQALVDHPVMAGPGEEGFERMS